MKCALTTSNNGHVQLRSISLQVVKFHHQTSEFTVLFIALLFMLFFSNLGNLGPVAFLVVEQH